MSIDSSVQGLVVISCDACGDLLDITESDVDTTSLSEILTFARENGWSRKKRTHLCPICSATSRTDRRHNQKT